MADFKLHPECPLEAELSRVLCHQLDRALTKVGQRRDSVKARIHIARTSCKKARALLKLVRSGDRDLYRRENRRLGEAARRLAPLRDADAMLDSFTALRNHAKKISRSQFEQVRHALLLHRRSTAPSSAETERALHQFRQELRHAKKRVRDWKPASDFDSIVASFCRTYARSRNAMRDARNDSTVETFHEWRKAAKACLYQLQLFRLTWPRVVKALVKEFAGLGDLLGGEHDLSILRQHLRGLYRKNQISISEAAFVAAMKVIAVRRENLRTEAFKIGKRLFAEKPRAMAERLATWWQLTARNAIESKAA